MDLSVVWTMKSKVYFIAIVMISPRVLTLFLSNEPHQSAIIIIYLLAAQRINH